MRIIPRAEWGARHRNGFGTRRLPATQAWLHHSASLAPDLVAPFDDDYAAIRALEETGQQRFGGGISYTRLITPAGLIFEGHGIDRVGSHTANRNTVSVGYCLVGNYDTARPNEVQLRALAWCLQHDHNRGWLRAARLDGGHRDLKSTACPGGYVYPLIGEINRLAAGPPITELEEDHMQNLILAREQGGEAIWVGNFVFRRHVADTEELEGLQYWMDRHGEDSTIHEFADLRVLGDEVTDPVSVDLTDAQLEVLADKVATRLRTIQFVAKPEGNN